MKRNILLEIIACAAVWMIGFVMGLVILGPSIMIFIVPTVVCVLMALLGAFQDIVKDILE